MKYRDYLTACTIMHKTDLIEKAIEYMETVPVSTEAYEAIKDMLNYEKEGLIENFRTLAEKSSKEQINIEEEREEMMKDNAADWCCPNEEEVTRMAKLDNREVDEVFC